MTDLKKNTSPETSYELPPLGGNPSTQGLGTNPGSFARPAQFGRGVDGAWTFSSPDTPGMPPVSDKTAWDFMPDDWTLVDEQWRAPEGFTPVTQLEHARLGTITPEMERVAQREPHLTADQIRDEVAAGRMIIPANRVVFTIAHFRVGGHQLS